MIAGWFLKDVSSNLTISARVANYFSNILIISRYTLKFA